MARGTTSVVVVDQHEIFRTGLSAILEALGNVALTATGATADDAVRLAHSKRPNVIVVDGALDAADPGSLVRQIRAASPGTVVIVLAADPRPNDVLASVAAGAGGYLLKSAPREDLAGAIERSLAGETFVDPVLAGRLVQAMTEQAKAASSESRPEPLTPRERQVLAEISHGRSNKEIASDLSMASGTVKIHVERILRKLSAANRVEAATIGLNHGLIPGDPQTETMLGETRSPRA